MARNETVAALLAESDAAHRDYRMALTGRVTTPGGTVRVPGDPEAARAALMRAFALRLEAEHLDVAGDAEVWRYAESASPHYALLRFYMEQEAGGVSSL
jgi:hypothetical protein